MSTLFECTCVHIASLSSLSLPLPCCSCCCLLHLFFFSSLILIFLYPSIVKQWMTATMAEALTAAAFSVDTTTPLSRSRHLLFSPFQLVLFAHAICSEFHRTFIRWRCITSLLFAAIPLYFNNFFILLCTRALTHSHTHIHSALMLAAFKNKINRQNGF